MKRALGLSLFLATLPVAARAATFGDPVAYCAAVGTIDRPDARYTGEAVPDWIAHALMRATDAPADAPLAAFKRATWRGDRGRVLACSYGANIPCDERAAVSREPGQGARAFCHDNPDSSVVPAVATGHASIYQWRCQGARPVIARQVLKVDRRGFPSAFWHVVSPE